MPTATSAFAASNQRRRLAGLGPVARSAGAASPASLAPCIARLAEASASASRGFGVLPGLAGVKGRIGHALDEAAQSRLTTRRSGMASLSLAVTSTSGP